MNLYDYNECSQYNYGKTEWFLLYDTYDGLSDYIINSWNRFFTF